MHESKERWFCLQTGIKGAFDTVSCGGFPFITKEPPCPESFIKPQKAKEASALTQTLNRTKLNGTCRKGEVSGRLAGRQHFSRSWVFPTDSHQWEVAGRPDPRIWGATHTTKYATLYVPITMRQSLSDAESIYRIGKEDQSSVDDDKYVYLKPFPDVAQRYLGAEPPTCTVQE